MSIQCVNHDHGFYPIVSDKQRHPGSILLEPPTSLTLHTKEISNVNVNVDTAVLVRQSQDHGSDCRSFDTLDNSKAATSMLLLQKIQNVNEANNLNTDAPSGNGTESTTSSVHQRAELMSSISTLYATLIVVMGVVVPVTSSTSHRVPVYFEQGFYVYLYVTSVVFIISMYTIPVRRSGFDRYKVKQDNAYLFAGHGTTVDGQHDNYNDNNDQTQLCHQPHNYGSFCLRLGTVSFGAGLLVLTGLKIGAEIADADFEAVVPVSRLVVVTAQMYFIFLNNKQLELSRHKAYVKLGLMHMIATNICEWLLALVTETYNEIFELERKTEEPAGVLKQLLKEASPFLYPCTIEFSLICALILFEMWKRLDDLDLKPAGSSKQKYQLSIDCGSAQTGLFGGVLVIAGTVLSLIMFFVLKDVYPDIAVQQVTAFEIAIHVTGLIAAVIASIKVFLLDFRDVRPPSLDKTLLDAAQTGLYSHSLFGAVGVILTQGQVWPLYLATDLLDVVQSTAQTVLIKIAWKRRSKMSTAKPGKELITFLIVINLALWTVNTFEKSRAGIRPDHLAFFGVWSWTIITHVSMPLAIFYRFHSAICLFEVWKSCYKSRHSCYCRTHSIE